MHMHMASMQSEEEFGLTMTSNSRMDLLALSEVALQCLQKDRKLA